MDLELGIAPIKDYGSLRANCPPPSTARTLRPDQVTAVDAFLTWRNAPEHAANQSVADREALIALSMGLGKTVIAAECLKAEVLSGGQVLWVTHRQDLKQQSSTTIKTQTGLDSSLAIRKRSVKDIHICANSIGEASLDKIGVAMNPTLIVIDEAHHAFADTYVRIKQRFPNAKILNLTATPYRQDIANEMDLGEKLAVKTPTEAIDQGLLAPYRTVARLEHDFLKAGIAHGDYKVEGLSKLMRTPEMLEASTSEIVKHSPGRRGLVYCCNRSHAYEVRDMLRDKGLSVGLIEAKTPMDERQKIYQALENGELDQIVNINCLTEGFDLPAVDMITVLRPTRNASLYVQMVGRGLRLCPTTGKQDCILIDAFDVSKAKGKAQATQLPYPEELTRKRALVGKPISAAALYLSWFEGVRDPKKLATSLDVYQAVYPNKTPSAGKLAELDMIWDSSRLPASDPDGYDSLAFALGCNGVEHLHKVLTDRGYFYFPHGEQKAATSISLGVEERSNPSAPEVRPKGRASVTVNPDLKNFVLSLLDPDVNALERQKAQMSAVFLKTGFGQEIPTYWFRDPVTDLEYIAKSPTYTDASRSEIYSQSFLIRTPKGRNVIFTTHAPLDPADPHPYVLDEKGAPVLFTDAKGVSKPLASLGKFQRLRPEYIPSTIPRRHRSDEALQDLCTDKQRWRIAKEYKLNRRQAAELTIPQALASFLLDQKQNYFRSTLDHIKLRVDLVDAYFDAHPHLVT